MAQVIRRPVEMTTVDRVPPILTEDEKRRKALENLVGQMADWCGRMADAIQQAAVEAEGAVE